MPLPKYSRLDTSKSFCLHCHSPLTLLYHRQCQTRFAMFYICWICDSIFEAGKGEVKGEVE